MNGLSCCVLKNPMSSKISNIRLQKPWFTLPTENKKAHLEQILIDCHAVNLRYSLFTMAFTWHLRVTIWGAQMPGETRMCSLRISLECSFKG